MVTEKMPPYFILCSWKRSIVSPFVVSKVSTKMDDIFPCGVETNKRVRAFSKYRDRDRISIPAGCETRCLTRTRC